MRFLRFCVPSLFRAQCAQTRDNGRDIENKLRKTALGCKAIYLKWSNEINWPTTRSVVLVSLRPRSNTVTLFLPRHSRVSTLDSKRSRFFALFHLRWQRELCVVQHHIYAINACFLHECQVLFPFVVLNACHNNEIALRRTLAKILFDYGYLLVRMIRR